jgi:hypothetical protein
MEMSATLCRPRPRNAASLSAARIFLFSAPRCWLLSNRIQAGTELAAKQQIT